MCNEPTLGVHVISDGKNACDNVMGLLVGKGPYGKYASWCKDGTHRRDCKNIGVFRDVWIPDVPAATTPTISASTTPDVPAATTSATSVDPAPLPWRLTGDQIKLLSKRTKSMRWPHHMERMFYRGFSMWEKPSRMWKCRRKHRLLYHVLPVQLRDQVPRFRNAIVLFAWTMRRLDGQVHCYEDALRLGVLPGSRVLVRRKIKGLHKDLICALVLIEGSVPVGHLIPTWHHFVHYCEFTETHGILRWFWMMAFERFVLLVVMLILLELLNMSMSNTSHTGTINT